MRENYSEGLEEYLEEAVVMIETMKSKITTNTSLGLTPYRTGLGQTHGMMPNVAKCKLGGPRVVRTPDLRIRSAKKEFFTVWSQMLSSYIYDNVIKNLTVIR
jgi:hypothetical protein